MVSFKKVVSLPITLTPFFNMINLYIITDEGLQRIPLTQIFNESSPFLSQISNFIIPDFSLPDPFIIHDAQIVPREFTFIPEKTPTLIFVNCEVNESDSENEVEFIDITNAMSGPN